MDKFIAKWLTYQTKATEKQLTHLTKHVAAAPFATGLLEVDEALWGGFWHGDVISPGYSLSAVELALLRAIRLDGDWPENRTVPQFLADLRRAILHPQAGIWLVNLSGLSCAIFAAPTATTNFTVVWYCAATGQLHAGYQARGEDLGFDGVLEQRPPGGMEPSQATIAKASGPEAAYQPDEEMRRGNLTAQLDRAILAWRRDNSGFRSIEMLR